MTQRTHILSMAGTVLAGGLLLAGCGGSGGGGDDTADTTTTESTAVTGTAQKGPFQPGGTAVATRLAADGTETSDSVSGSIGEDGDYSLPEITWSGATELELSGAFFDENAGSFTSNSRTLRAVVDAAGGSVDTNVNIFTHFVAARVKVLMNGGTAVGDALTQARDEAKAALDISTAPADLNLLDATDTSEIDSANLLMFSAAALKAGIDQAGLDALAGDFADDGMFNGEGADEFRQVENESGSTLLSDARNALKNQYGTEPPNTSNSGFGWLLDECSALKLNVSNRPVFCTSDEQPATVGRSTRPSDKRGALAFVSVKPGIYRIEVVVPTDRTAYSGNSWELFHFDDSDSRDNCAGSSTYDEGSGSSAIEGLTGRLGIFERYCLENYVSPAPTDGGADELSVFATRVSEGGASIDEAVDLTLGETYSATVGNYVTSGSDMPAYSYYAFRVKQSGDYRIKVWNYSNLGSGSMRIGLFGDQDDSGSITFYNDQERMDFTGGPSTDSTTTIMEKTLSAGTYVVRIFNGTGYRESFENGTYALTSTDFDIVVEEI